MTCLNLKFFILGFALSLLVLECNGQPISVETKNPTDKNQNPESKKNAEQMQDPFGMSEQEFSNLFPNADGIERDDPAANAASESAGLSGSQQQPWWMGINKQSGMPQVVVERLVIVKPVPILLAIVLKNKDGPDDELFNPNESGETPNPVLNPSQDTPVSDAESVSTEDTSKDNNSEEKKLDAGVDYADPDESEEKKSPSQPEEKESDEKNENSEEIPENGNDSNETDEAEAYNNEENETKKQNN